MINTEALGKKIEALRRERGITQRTLAEILSVSFQAVSNWERGIAPPDIGNLVGVADYFGITVDELIRTVVPEEMYLGVDGGGTKTELCVVNRAGTVLKRVVTSGSNPNDAGYGATLNMLLVEIGQIMAEFKSIRSAFLGISGITTGDYAKRLRQDLSHRFPKTVFNIGSDSQNLFAFDPRAEMAVISGTGSVVFVKTKDGYRRIGGWGHLLDNAGSAFDIGRAALRIALGEEDSHKAHSTMSRMLLEKLGTKTAWESIGKIYAEGKPYIASLSSVVFECAAEGDADALGIIEENARALANLLNEGVRIYGASPVAVASGGVLEHNTEIMLSLMHKYTDTEIIVSDLPPIYGATRRAVSEISDAGIEFYSEFKRTYK